jgi:hypothetical protein
MKPTLPHASSMWLSSLAALLVAIGSQTLLESVVPASFAEWLSVSSGSGTIYRAGSGLLWPSGAIIRLVSFVLGGFVGARLAGALTGRLVAGLLLVSVLATIFQQFPGNPSLLGLILWSLAGPVGVVLGAWAGNAKRAAV